MTVLTWGGFGVTVLTWGGFGVTVLTWGGSGVGSAVRAGALASLLYHQSRNCRKNTPTDRPVERAVAAPCRTPLDNALNQLWDLGKEEKPTYKGTT